MIQKIATVRRGPLKLSLCNLNSSDRIYARNGKRVKDIEMCERKELLTFPIYQILAAVVDKVHIYSVKKVISFINIYMK